MISRTLISAGLLLALTFEQAPPLARVAIPPPLRVLVPFPAVWEAMHESLLELQLEIDSEDRSRGSIRTRYLEYSSGPLTESHLSKVGEKPQLWDGQWTKVENQYDILIELIGDKEALVTVDANIRALQRPFLGSEKWVDIRSNGRLEADLLTHFGQKLFGQTFTLATPKKGFWQQEPGYVPDGELRPKITGPERRPPDLSAIRPRDPWLVSPLGVSA